MLMFIEFFNSRVYIVVLFIITIRCLLKGVCLIALICLVGLLICCSLRIWLLALFRFCFC